MTIDSSGSVTVEANSRFGHSEPARDLSPPRKVGTDPRPPLHRERSARAHTEPLTRADGAFGPSPNDAAAAVAPSRRRTRSIADRYADLLAPLNPRRRRGLIAQLSQGFYEGWRPTRAEVAELVAQDIRKAP